MTLRPILEIAGSALALLFGFSWMQSREATVKMQATLDAQKQVMAQAVADREQHVKEDAARDAATAAMLKTWQQTVAGLKTPQQQVAWSQEQLAEALKGIQITLNPKTGEAVAVLPAATIPELPAVIEKCRECELKFTTSQADLVSREQQMQLADLEIKSLQTQRDAAVVAAKGGTKWQRFGRAVKWLAVGAGIGYVAAKSH